MAASLGEGKLWIQTSCRPREKWAQPGYSCPRVVPLRPNQVMETVRGLRAYKIPLLLNLHLTLQLV